MKYSNLFKEANARKILKDYEKLILLELPDINFKFKHVRIMEKSYGFELNFNVAFDDYDTSYDVTQFDTNSSLITNTYHVEPLLMFLLNKEIIIESCQLERLEKL